MTPERWRQVNELFHAAVDRAPAERQQILEAAAARDPLLAAEVRSLLAVHESGGEVLESPVWAAAPELTLDEDEQGLAPGSRAGAYRIAREIGRGGMGIVYEAEDTRLRRRVALKALPARYARDAGRRERLTREARAAAALVHPGIATIHALEEIEGVLYLVSELVEGRTLRDEIRQGPLPVERLRQTLIELSAGLAAAHAGGIVHRDFKPENIIRCPDGRVKILDFGLARTSADDAVTELRLTQTGAALGTPGYMAPEQLAGRHVDARADVFAFGVVGWELATATHPFGTTAAELLARMTDAVSGRPVTGAGAAIPIAGLEAVLRQCLRTDPSDRFASAIELHGALERLEWSPDGETSAPRRVTRSMRWWQVHQAAVAAAVAAMPVVCWFVRRADARLGSVIFLTVLALATVAVAIRLNLLFTSRVNPRHLGVQRARTYRPLVAVEAVLGTILLLAAAAVSGLNDALAGTLVTLAVATVVSLAIIEPATTAAALGGDRNGLGRGRAG